MTRAATCTTWSELPIPLLTEIRGVAKHGNDCRRRSIGAKRASPDAASRDRGPAWMIATAILARHTTSASASRPGCRARRDEAFTQWIADAMMAIFF